MVGTLKYIFHFILPNLWFSWKSFKFLKKELNITAIMLESLLNVCSTQIIYVLYSMVSIVFMMTLHDVFSYKDAEVWKVLQLSQEYSAKKYLSTGIYLTLKVIIYLWKVLYYKVTALFCYKTIPQPLCLNRHSNKTCQKLRVLSNGNSRREMRQRLVSPFACGVVHGCFHWQL